MALSYEDLLAEEEREAAEKGVPFIGKGGAKIILRPVVILPRADQVLILNLSEAVQKDDLAVEAKLDAIDKILVAAADKKKPMKDSLAGLALQSKMRIFEEWMKAADLPESSPSAS
jgi:hypothetical protein